MRRTRILTWALRAKNKLTTTNFLFVHHTGNSPSLATATIAVSLHCANDY